MVNIRTGDSAHLHSDFKLDFANSAPESQRVVREHCSGTNPLLYCNIRNLHGHYSIHRPSRQQENAISQVGVALWHIFVYACACACD